MSNEQLPAELREAGMKLLAAWKSRSDEEQQRMAQALQPSDRPALWDEAEVGQATAMAERIAAVSGRVDPAALVSFVEDLTARSVVLDRLASSFDRAWRTSSWSWTLKSDRRASVLRNCTGGELAQALSSAAIVPTDKPGEALRHLLSHAALPAREVGPAGQAIADAWTAVAVLTPSDAVEQRRPPGAPLSGHEGELEAQAIAHAWAALADPSLLDEAAALRIKVNQQEALRVFDNLLVGGFFGRDGEIARLRSFAERADTSGPIPLLPMSGIGGSGKSTLLAQALRPLLETAFKSGISPMVVCLDFDHRRFLTGAELELTFELSRQVALYFPDISQRLASLRNNIVHQRADRGEFSKSQFDSGAESASRHGNEFLYQASGLIRESGAPLRPIVVVLDTFEEWQRAYVRMGSQESPLWRVMDWLSDVRREWDLKLRVIVSGRAPVPRVPNFEIATPIELGELSRRSSVALLKSLGLPAGAARAMARLAGGMPLALKLAARYYLRLPPDRRPAFLAQTEEELKGLDAELRQGVLYRRFLDHIPDEQARKLAHPGLALRRVSRALIRHVLAGPCDLGVMADPDAGELLEILAKEVWLVEEQWPELVHRPELRKAMLRSMRGDPLQAQRLHEVHRAAVQWYKQRPNPSERDVGEALYHQLMITPAATADGVIADADRSMLQLLAPSVGDFPDPIRVRLQDRLGMRLTAADAALLPLERRVAWAQRQAEELVRTGQPEKALSVWRQHGAGPPQAWIVTALYQTHDWLQFGPALQEVSFEHCPLRYFFLASFLDERQANRSALSTRKRLSDEAVRRLMDGEPELSGTAVLEDAYFATVLGTGSPLKVDPDLARRWLDESPPNATAYLRICAAIPTLALRPNMSTAKAVFAGGFRPTPVYVEEVIRRLHQLGSTATATTSFARELFIASGMDLSSAQILGSWSDRFARAVQADLKSGRIDDISPLLEDWDSDDPEWRVPIRLAIERAHDHMWHPLTRALEDALATWAPADLHGIKFESDAIRSPRTAWKRAIEYIDRCGALPSLMKVAVEGHDRKLADVASAYLLWRDRVHAMNQRLRI